MEPCAGVGGGGLCGERGAVEGETKFCEVGVAAEV